MAEKVGAGSPRGSRSKTRSYTSGPESSEESRKGIKHVAERILSGF